MWLLNRKRKTWMPAFAGMTDRKHLIKILGALLLFPIVVHAQSVAALFHHPNDPYAGNPKGNVTVVEFFDYQCSHCLTMANTVAAIIKTNPNVRVIFKEVPLDGPISEFASRAALAANKQGKYYPFSHAMLTSRTRLTPEKILTLAKMQGIDLNQLKKTMHDPYVNNQIRGNYQLWRNLKLTGTPSLFIGRTNTNSMGKVQYVIGEMSRSELQYAIDNAQ